MTDDDLDFVDEKCEQLVGNIWERHAIEREQAERQLNEFYDRL